ncbi:flagellar hook-length control protein FliK [Nocardioides sp. SR21]|uniref:flagellar hook-length control protein FliK n=1 Tax=Nocardioides sp. SR21 TaxID=2919501 RepID=UPI001FA9F533|nr:flagellar hook-length control protein FliK [Nocardioides sp. SR21]
MTTTPIGLFPGLVPGQAGQSTGQAGTSGSTGSTGDAFLALVQGLLDGAAQPGGDLAAAVPGQEPVQLPVEGSTAATADVIDALVKPATEDAQLATVVPDAPAVDVPTTSLPDINTAAAAVVPVLAPVTIQAPPAEQASAATATAAPAVAAVPAVTAAVATPAALPTTPVADRPASAKADEPTVATGTAPTSAPDAELPDVAVAGVEQRPATSEQRSATAPATTTVAPVAGTAPVTTTSSAAPVDASQVTRQVFPEVVRVVNNPNGPQRVTIKLNPEALGEVRVVLTSRGGNLEVSLAAGADARAALTEGASELHRLLDLVGRGDSRIVVRDLLGAQPGTTVSQPAAASSGSGVPTDLAGGAGSWTGRPGGENATGGQSRNHTNGSNNATDGTQAPTNPSRPTESVTQARTGLDVTM